MRATKIVKGHPRTDAGPRLAAVDIDKDRLADPKFFDAGADARDLLPVLAAQLTLRQPVRSYHSMTDEFSLSPSRHRLMTTTSKYSLGTTMVPSSALFMLAIKASRSLRSPCCLAASRAANALSIGP